MKVQRFCSSILVLACTALIQDELCQAQTECFYRKYFYHPLNPLSSREIRETSDIVKKNHAGEPLMFSSIILLEPPKSVLAAFLRSSGEGSEFARAEIIPRKSVAVFHNAMTGDSYETIINLSEQMLESSKKLSTGVQPLLTEYEHELRQKIALKDQRILQRLTKLGLDSKSVFAISPVAAGFNQLDPAVPGKRIIQCVFGFEKFKNDNYYAHPLDFRALVDLVERKVILLEDLPQYINTSTTPKAGSLTKTTLPSQSANYEPAILGKQFYRKDVQPLRVTSAGGPAFKLKGHQVLWQKFKMRLSFNIREGLVIHDVSYKQGSKVRPLIYRASISETVIPYGDGRDPRLFHSPLDQGFFGLGNEAAIRPNIECFPDGHRMSVVVNNIEGLPRKVKRVICIHEEDGGILYKHSYFRKTTIARSRVLVIHYVATLDNYDYGFYWRFHQDAKISLQVGISGLLSTNLNLGGKSPYASRMLPKVDAQFHQHFFSARLDTNFDGETNTVSMVDVVPAPDSENMRGNGFTTSETVFNTSLDSVTDTNILTSRTWKISNPNSINPETGRPVAWKLVPMNRKLLLARKGSLTWKTARFAAHSIWVTPYRDRELFAAGDYPYLRKGGQGLPKWVQRNESIVGRDIVVYHTFGLTHIPRLEDFPLMAFEKTGFTLKPCNFFTSFPGLDVPNTV